VPGGVVAVAWLFLWQACLVRTTCGCFFVRLCVGACNVGACSQRRRPSDGARTMAAMAAALGPRPRSHRDGRWLLLAPRLRWPRHRRDTLDAVRRARPHTRATAAAAPRPGWHPRGGRRGREPAARPRPCAYCCTPRVRSAQDAFSLTPADGDASSATRGGMPPADATVTLFSAFKLMAPVRRQRLHGDRRRPQQRNERRNPTPANAIVTLFSAFMHKGSFVCDTVLQWCVGEFETCR
jgi:hypothetical protein